MKLGFIYALIEPKDAFRPFFIIASFCNYSSAISVDVFPQTRTATKSLKERIRS